MKRITHIIDGKDIILLNNNKFLKNGAGETKILKLLLNICTIRKWRDIQSIVNSIISNKMVDVKPLRLNLDSLLAYASS